MKRGCRGGGDMEEIVHAVELDGEAVAPQCAGERAAVRSDRHGDHGLAGQSAGFDHGVSECVASGEGGRRGVAQLRTAGFEDDGPVNGCAEREQVEWVSIRIGVVGQEIGDLDEAVLAGCGRESVGFREHGAIRLAGEVVLGIGDAIAVGIDEERVGVESEFEDVSGLGGEFGDVVPAEVATKLYGVFIARVVRLAGSEVGEGGDFAGDGAESAFDEAVGVADPGAGCARVRAEECDECGIFGGAGQREEVAAAGHGVVACGQPVAGDVADERDAADAEFEAVGEAVAVGIGEQRRCADGDLCAIGQAVAIGVGDERVGAGGEFLAIGEAVVIGVRQERIGADGEFIGVGEAVAIGIETAVVEEWIETGGKFVGVGNAVAIFVAAAGAHVECDRGKWQSVAGAEHFDFGETEEIGGEVSDADEAGAIRDEDGSADLVEGGGGAIDFAGVVRINAGQGGRGEVGIVERRVREQHGDAVALGAAVGPPENADERNVRGLAEIDFPPGMEIGIGVGDGAGRKTSVAIAIDGELRRTAEAGGRLGDRLAGGEAVGEDISAAAEEVGWRSEIGERGDGDGGGESRGHAQAEDAAGGGINDAFESRGGGTGGERDALAFDDRGAGDGRRDREIGGDGESRNDRSDRIAVGATDAGGEFDGVGRVENKLLRWEKRNVAAAAAQGDGPGDQDAASGQADGGGIDRRWVERFRESGEHAGGDRSAGGAVGGAEEFEDGRDEIGQDERADDGGGAAGGVGGGGCGGEGGAGARGGGDVEDEGRALGNVGCAGDRDRLRTGDGAGERDLERGAAAIVSGVDFQEEWLVGIEDGGGGRADEREGGRGAVGHFDFEEAFASAEAAGVGGGREHGDFRAGHGGGRNDGGQEDGGAGGVRLERSGPGAGARGAERGDAAVVNDGDADLSGGPAEHGGAVGGDEFFERDDGRLVFKHGDVQLGERAFVAETVDGDGAVGDGADGGQGDRQFEHAGFGGGEGDGIRAEADAHVRLGGGEHGLERDRCAGGRRRAVLDAQTGECRADRVERGERAADRLVGHFVAGDVAHAAHGGCERGVGRQRGGRHECQDQAVHAEADGAGDRAGRSAQSDCGARLDRFVHAEADDGLHADLLGAVLGSETEQDGRPLVARGEVCGIEDHERAAHEVAGSAVGDAAEGVAQVAVHRQQLVGGLAFQRRSRTDHDKPARRLAVGSDQCDGGRDGRAAARLADKDASGIDGGRVECLAEQDFDRGVDVNAVGVRRGHARHDERRRLVEEDVAEVDDLAVDGDRSGGAGQSVDRRLRGRDGKRAGGDRSETEAAVGAGAGGERAIRIAERTERDEDIGAIHGRRPVGAHHTAEHGAARGEPQVLRHGGAVGGYGDRRLRAKCEREGGQRRFADRHIGKAEVALRSGDRDFRAADRHLQADFGARGWGEAVGLEHAAIDDARSAQDERERLFGAAVARGDRSAGHASRFAEPARGRAHGIWDRGAGEHAHVFKADPAVGSGVGGQEATVMKQPDGGLGGRHSIGFEHEDGEIGGRLQRQVDFQATAGDGERGVGGSLERAERIFGDKIERARGNGGKRIRSVGAGRHGALAIYGKGIVQREFHLRVRHGSGAKPVGDEPEDGAEHGFGHENVARFVRHGERDHGDAGPAGRRIGDGQPVRAERHVGQREPSAGVGRRNGQAREIGVREWNRGAAVGGDELAAHGARAAKHDRAFAGAAGRDMKRRASRDARATQRQAGVRGVGALKDVGELDQAGAIGRPLEFAAREPVHFDFRGGPGRGQPIGAAHEQPRGAATEQGDSHAVVLAGSDRGIGPPGRAGRLVESGHGVPAGGQGERALGGGEAAVGVGADEEVVAEADLHADVGTGRGAIRGEHLAGQAAVGFLDGGKLQQNVGDDWVDLRGASARADDDREERVGGLQSPVTDERAIGKRERAERGIAVEVGLDAHGRFAVRFRAEAGQAYFRADGHALAVFDDARDRGFRQEADRRDDGFAVEAQPHILHKPPLVRIERVAFAGEERVACAGKSGKRRAYRRFDLLHVAGPDLRDSEIRIEVLDRWRGRAQVVEPEPEVVEGEQPGAVGAHPHERTHVLVDVNRDGHVDVGHRAAGLVEHLAGDASGRGKPDDGKVVVPGQHGQGGGPEAGEVTPRIRMPGLGAQAGADLAFAGGDALDDEGAEFVGGGERFTAADDGAGHRVAIGEFDAAAHGGAGLESDVGGIDGAFDGGDVVAFAFAAAVAGNGDDFHGAGGHVIDAPEAAGVGDGLRECGAGYVGGQDGAHVNRGAVVGSAIGFDDASLQRGARDDGFTKHDREVERLARAGKQGGNGACAAGDGRRLDAQRADRHAIECEATIAVGEHAAAEFARVRIGEKIDRRAGRGRRAVGLQHGACDRAAAAEGQHVHAFAALARVRRKVAHHRAVEPFGQGDRLRDRGHAEGAAQRGAGDIGRCHAAGQIDAERLEPRGRHLAVAAAFEDDGDGLVVADRGDVGGREGERNAADHEGEREVAVVIGERLGDAHADSGATVRRDRGVVHREGDRQAGAAGAVGADDAAAHGQAFDEARVDRHVGDGEFVAADVGHAGANAQRARDEGAHRPPEREQRDAAARLDLDEGGLGAVVERVSGCEAGRFLGHRFIEEDGDDVPVIADENTFAEIVGRGGFVAARARPGDVQLRILAHHQRLRSGLHEVRCHAGHREVGVAVAGLVDAEVGGRAAQIEEGAGAGRDVVDGPFEAARGAVGPHLEHAEPCRAGQRGAEFPLHGAGHGADDPGALATAVARGLHEGACVHARAAAAALQKVQLAGAGSGRVVLALKRAARDRGEPP